MRVFLKSVTVAIPSYYAEKFIMYAIKSILQQSHFVDEIIICDDFSKDNTVQIVREIIENNSNSTQKIKLYINDANLGYQRNWNKCLEYAASDFVLLLHADDMLKPDTIEKQLQFFKEHPELALVGGYEDSIDQNGDLKRGFKGVETEIYKKGQIYEFVRNQGSYIACSSVMFNMEKIREVGFFEPNVLATDELYWPRVLTKFPIAIIGESLILRRSHSDQTEYKDFVEKHREVMNTYYDFNKIIEYESRYEYKKKLKSILKVKFSNSALAITRSVLKYHNNSKIALKYLLFSMKIDPSVLINNSRFWKVLAILSLYSAHLSTYIPRLPGKPTSIK